MRVAILLFASLWAFACKAQITTLDQFDLTGSWYEPDVAGQGLVVEVIESRTLGPESAQAYFFAGWFTYSDRSGGVDEQMWYTLEGRVPVVGSTIALDILRTPPGRFLAGTVRPVRVGSASLTVLSCTRARMVFAFDAANGGRTGEVQYVRLTDNVSCEAGAKVANAPRSFLSSGAWFDPSMAGQGVFLEVNPVTRYLFGAWYTYTDTGAADHRWYTLQKAGIDPNSLEVSDVGIFESTGGRFDAPSATSIRRVGTARVRSRSCERTEIEYSFSSGDLAGRSGTLRLDRVAGRPRECGDLVTGIPASRADAARFLAQASFGPTKADIDRLMAIGYDAWITEQFAMPPQHVHAQHVRRMAARNTDQHWPNRPGIWDMNDSMWIGLTSADQLRQRVMFALSQIHVVSLRDGSTYYQGSALASYADMLGTQGLGNYRTYLEHVTRHPAMGNYLSHVYNAKEDPVTGRVPDQNFARELMQLFSIGLWELHGDGTRKLDAAGASIPTYGLDDVVGVSRVMTGWSYDGANSTHWQDFHGFRSAAEMPRQELLMRSNPAYHSTLEKRFLGTTIPAGGPPNPDADLRILLDRLFNHPNAGPFLSKQLIQRLVTSNPSPAYVARVSRVFEANGQGVRGDMRSVIRAILLDPEARDRDVVQDPMHGRLREQIQRMAHLMRVFKASPAQDPLSFQIPMWTYDVRKGLWQTPLGSPSVFNFYAPDFAPSRSDLAARGGVSPEMQIITTISVSDTTWWFTDLLQNGGWTSCCTDAERNTYRMRFDYGEWLPLVRTPDLLVERLNEEFLSGQMSPQLRQTILQGIANQQGNRSATSGMIRGSDQMKLAAAVGLVQLSPEYVVQK